MNGFYVGLYSGHVCKRSFLMEERDSLLKKMLNKLEVAFIKDSSSYKNSFLFSNHLICIAI